MRIDIKRKRIVSALLQLLENKNWDDITIADIVELADITRPTFYKYFDNKLDILRYLLKVYHDEAIEMSESFSDYKVNMLNVFLEKRSQNPKAFDRIMQTEAFNIYQNAVYQYVFKLIEEIYPQYEVTESTRVAARIWSAGSVATLRSWLADTRDSTAEEFCEFYTLGMPDIVYQAFEANTSKQLVPHFFDDHFKDR